MRLLAPIAIVVLVLATLNGRASNSDSGGLSLSPMPDSPEFCPVTLPNAVAAPAFGQTDPPQAAAGYDGGYGNEALWTNLWMWGEGEVPVPASHIGPDGSLGDLKWAWYRFRPGRLEIDGRRLDATGPPLRAQVPDGYGETGFQVTGLTFPTPGCWEITGRLGGATLTFVTVVVASAARERALATPTA